ncbi:MAG: MBL fold metallo-hydrolase [Bacteroides sp.]|nr:MBL fold metallo-hydrolase [Bacteroides sp.]
MKRLINMLFICGAIVVLQACGGGSDTPAPDNNQGNNQENNQENNQGNGNEETPDVVDEIGYDVASIMNAFWTKTSYTKRDEKRLLAMERMQAFADLCENTEFKKYYACTEAQEAVMEEGSILLFHSKAVEKVLEEIQKQEVETGHIVMWQVYNMGYVIKTPTHTFGIDLKHKHAARFAPYIDFLLITHAHEDHYTTALTEAMMQSGKPVYSNFVENDYKITEGKTINIVDDIIVETAIVDHNKTDLKNFVVTYRIDCGANTNHCIVYHVGDACDESQLTPTQPINIFIPHLANNLNMPQAVMNIKPDVVLLSHILEMDHPTTKWRWSYEYGVKCCKELEEDGTLKYEKAYLPVWGEKITY